MYCYEKLQFVTGQQMFKCLKRVIFFSVFSLSSVRHVLLTGEPLFRWKSIIILMV